MQNVAFVVNVAPFVMLILFIIGCKCMNYCILFSQQSLYLYVSQKCKIHVILERGGKCIFVNLSGFSIKYFIQSNIRLQIFACQCQHTILFYGIKCCF